MKKTRKIISLLLSLLMIITSVPLMAVNSFAADVVNSGATGDCTWTLDSDGVLTISGNGKMKDYSRGDASPWGTSITKVVIENGVTNIGISSFENCTSLTSVTIPDSVTSIGAWAFDRCISLKSITIPDNLTSIGVGAFEYCTSLTSVTIPDSVTEIGYLGFYGCTSLTSITIPNGVTEIGSQTFGSCTSLTSLTIPDSVTEISDNAFSGCKSLTSITIGNGVTSIGWGVFSGCTSLTIITIPNSVTSIGEYAFRNCTSLVSVTIPDSVISIGNGAFDNTAYYNNISNWDNGLLYIGNHLIEAKEDVSGNVEIKRGTKIIADSAFSGCTSLTNIIIPNSVMNVGYFAFKDCTSLTNIIIPNSVTNVGCFAFKDCASLTSVTIPSSITSIDNGAFIGCSLLTSVTIPASVTEIGIWAFGYYNEEKTIDGFKIYGIVGSEAERYADDNSIEFISIDGTPVKSFPDVTRGDWYYSAVKYNSRNGYVTGYSNGTFGPANNIQRQDFVLILARIAGADLSAYEGQNGGFSDVQTGSYYASAVAWAKDTGVANGFSADNFGVGTYISREQICIMLCRYLNGSVSGDADTILNAYSDGGNTSPWAKDSVAWAVENGIIGNSDYLNPNGNAGRAEVAQIIYNMSNKGML